MNLFGIETTSFFFIVLLATITGLAAFFIGLIIGAVKKENQWRSLINKNQELQENKIYAKPKKETKIIIFCGTHHQRYELQKGCPDCNMLLKTKRGKRIES